MNVIKNIYGRVVRGWSYYIFPHLKNYRNIRQYTDVLYIGGTGASFYIKGLGKTSNEVADLSVSPMSISYMLRIVKNYHSYLKKHGSIILLLNPYSLCIKHYDGNSNISKDIRFYPILHNAMIEKFDNNISADWSRKFAPKNIKTLVAWMGLTFSKYTNKDEVTEVLNILKSGIDDNNEPCQSLKESIEENISYLKQIQEFSDERGYSLIIIVMKDFFKGTPLQKYDSILNEVLYKPLENAHIEVKA